MPPSSKEPRVKFLEAPPTADETAAEPTKRVRKFSQQNLDPATLNKHRPDASAEPPKRKTRPHKAVVFNRCTHHRDNSFRFSLACYCLRTHVTYTIAGRRESELLNLARLMRRVDLKCGHRHKYVIPYPLRMKRAITYPRISLRR